MKRKQEWPEPLEPCQLRPLVNHGTTDLASKIEEAEQWMSRNQIKPLMERPSILRKIPPG